MGVRRNDRHLQHQREETLTYGGELRVGERGTFAFHIGHIAAKHALVVVVHRFDAQIREAIGRQVGGVERELLRLIAVAIRSADQLIVGIVERLLAGLRVDEDPVPFLTGVARPGDEVDRTAFGRSHFARQQSGLTGQVPDLMYSTIADCCDV